MRLPRLRGHDPAVPNRLLIHKSGSRLLGIYSNVLVARHAFAAQQSGGRQYLYPMANREDPFFTAVELAQDPDDLRVVPQVFWRPASSTTTAAYSSTPTSSNAMPASSP